MTNKGKTALLIARIIVYSTFGPFMLVGFLFFGVGLYSEISIGVKSRGYEETIATHKYDSIYTFEVNGKRYETNTHVDKGSGNKERIKVKYNHDDPSENVSGFGESFSFVLIGFILGASMLALCIWSMKFAKSIIKANF